MPTLANFCNGAAALNDGSAESVGNGASGHQESFAIGFHSGRYI